LVHAFLHADGLVADFRHLVWGEGLLVLGVAAERQRVDRVLWVLLMENVSVAISPVRVVHLVRTVELHWLLAELVVKIDQVSTLPVAAVVNLTLSRLQIHLVGIDDLGFLLQVESALVVLCKSTFTLKLFLVVAVGFGRVWVAYKSIVATCLSSIQVVTNWHLFDFRLSIRQG
jgi:hypothetical protein